MTKEIIKGQAWTGYTGECKKRCPCYIIQEDPEDDWDDAIFICDILRKHVRKKVTITIKVEEQ